MQGDVLYYIHIKSCLNLLPSTFSATDMIIDKLNTGKISACQTL